jgi:hypothetical protein
MSRFDNPAVNPLMNTLRKGALGQMQNHALPADQQKERRRKRHRSVRRCGTALTPYARVLAAAKVRVTQNTELQAFARTAQPAHLGVRYRAAQESHRQSAPPLGRIGGRLGPKCSSALRLQPSRMG